MPEPTDVLLGLRASTADLVQDLADLHWTDDEVAAPSLLPGWTRGHVLTHLARNADGISGTLAAALRGEMVAQYPGGREQRNAAIDEGAGRPMTALLADVRESASRLDRVLGAVNDAEAWERPTGDDLRAREWVPRRWLEVEVHHVDLDAGYTPDRWPPLFVATTLPTLLATLDERSAVPARVTIAEQGSVSGAVSAELIGATRHVGSGDACEVTGPDWAVLAWLLGRPAAADGALTATPELTPWR